jgi:ATP-binding cassette subfamily B protein
MCFIYFAGKIAEITLFNLRRDLFAKLQYISFSYLDQNSAGWLLTRISSDTDRVAEVISWGLIQAGWGITMIIFCFGFMFYFSTKLAFFVLATIPILIIGTIFIRKKITKYSRQARKVNSELIGLVNEHIYGVDTNKILVNEEKASDIYRHKAEIYREKSYKSSFYSIAYFPIVVGLGSIATFFVLYMGGMETLNPKTGISIGALASFFIYSTLIFEPILDIASYYSIAQNSMSAGERIFSLLDEPIIVKDKNNKLSDFETIKGDIKLENISFRYNESRWIIENMNLEISSGSSIAIVGPTGEGKTTLASIISRFYEPSAGFVKIDGIDYRDRTLASYRSQVGVVLQHPSIFSGTLFENIQFGNIQITRERVAAILEIMQLEHFKNQLDMKISPDGNNLSVGEKQLIALARVFAYNPKILILDEATSNLDIQTERKLQHAIETLIKGRTSIIIAHRLTTIEACDRILLIEKGNIVEDGTHSELLSKEGKYFNLSKGLSPIEP